MRSASLRSTLTALSIAAAASLAPPAFAQIVSPNAPAIPNPDTPTIAPPILDTNGGGGPALLTMPGGGNRPDQPSPPVQPSAPRPAAEQQAQSPASTPQTSAATPPTSATPATPTGATVKAYGDWSTECFEKPVSGMSCQMLQKVVSGSQTVVVMAIAYDPASKATNIQIALPLGVSIPDGTQIAVGSDYQGKVAIDRCTQQGCIVEGSMTDDLIAAFKRQDKATIVVFNEAKTQIPLPFSLKGFTDAYQAMVAANQK